MRRDIQLSISCGDCVRQGTPDCDDCMVSYILGDARDTLTLTSSDTSAVDLLRAEGLMPELRFVHSTD